MGGDNPSHRPDQGAALERARSVQLSMLPRVPSLEAIEIACAYSACEYLGGDFYDFILVDSWRLGIVIADVSGHGTAAALLMAAGKKVIQMCARGNLSPRQTLLEVNDSLRADIPQGMFLSMLYGIVDVRNHRFCFASCGHNQPLLFRAGQVKHAWTHDNAPVVGVLPSSELKTHLNEEFVQLQPDDALVFYTDGITEAFNAERKMFTEERLHHRLSALGSKPAAFIVDGVHEEVAAFRGAVEQSDDETLLVMKFGKPPETPQPLVPLTPGSEDSLPTWQSPLLGRQSSVDELTRLLREQLAPIILLTGPAGVGKTRLAVAGVEAAHSRYPGGTHFIDLRRATGVADVCRQVAAVLRLPEDTANLGIRVATALQAMPEPMLLILDGCEGCADAVKRCVDEWRARAPGLRVLLTSRVSLDLPGRNLLTLQPLPHPQQGEVMGSLADALARYPSIELFSRVATAANPEFKLTTENLDEVARICARLDGLPQAIELIAARVSSLTPQQILKRLSKRSGLVRAGDDEGRSALHGTLSMSWDMLPEAERQALMTLSLFPAGFQLDVASEALAGIEGRAPEELVRSLLKHSLLRYDTPEGLDGDRRFYVYESARLFAAEKLRASAIEQTARLAFDRAVVKYTRRWQVLLEGRERRQARRRIELELETLQNVAKLTADPECRAWASVTLAPILSNRGEQDRAMSLLRGALADLPSESPAWPWVYITDGRLRVLEAPQYVEEMLRGIKGDTDATFKAQSIRALALLTLGRNDDALAVLEGLSKLPNLTGLHRASLKERIGRVYSQCGRTAEARTVLESAVALSLAEGDDSLANLARFQLSWLNARSSHVADALAGMKEVLKFAEDEGDRGLASRALGELALSHHVQGEKQESEACMSRALRIAREIGAVQTEVAQLNTLTRIYFEQGRSDDALKAATKARDLAQEIGSRRSEALAEGNIASLRANMGDRSVAMEAWERVHGILMEVGDKRVALSALSNIGAAYAERWKETKDPRDLKKAVQVLTEALSDRRKSGYDPIVTAEITLAELLSVCGRRAEAIDWLQKAVQAAAQRGDKDAQQSLAKGEALLAELTAPRGKRMTGRIPPRPGPSKLPGPAPVARQVSAPAPAARPTGISDRRPSASTPPAQPAPPKPPSAPSLPRRKKKGRRKPLPGRVKSSPSEVPTPKPAASPTPKAAAKPPAGSRPALGRGPIARRRPRS